MINISNNKIRIFQINFQKIFHKPLNEYWDKYKGIDLEKLIGKPPISWREVRKYLGIKGLFLYLRIFKYVRMKLIRDNSIKYEKYSLKWLTQKAIYTSKILRQHYVKFLFSLRVLYLSFR